MTRHLYCDFLSLQAVGLIIGFLLAITHALALVKPAMMQDFLRKFPRHRGIGITILAVDGIWAFWLIGNIDLGEFYTWENPIRIILPVCFLLFIFFVEEFLAVRAIGIFLLLLACPLLDVAFLREPVTRLLLPSLAYAWILLGLFWIGMPYLMREQITWMSGNNGRWRICAAAGLAYGVGLLVCAMMFWGAGNP
jgi:hypothetical protein|tara:strand:- start:132 stop:713 length:582 start_codon:yes stop_codon:yes gene_type:complete